MPTHEKLYDSTDVLDLSSESRASASPGGAAGGILGGKTEHALGESDIAAPTGVSAADKAATSGIVTVTVSGGLPSGCDAFSCVVRLASDGSFVKRVEEASSPFDVSGLTNDVSHTFDVRGVTSDNRVGRFATQASATPTAS